VARPIILSHSGSILLCWPKKNGKCRLGPAHRVRSGRTQATTWAWAGKASRPARPPRPLGRPDHLQPFDLIDGSPACFGRSKAAAAGFLRNPSSFSSPLSFSSFSLYRRSFLSAAQDREDSKRERARRARRWSVHGAVAGPLAGTRAPQRVSTPPSSGLAAAPPWPSPESQLPGSASSPAPAKGHPTRGEIDFLPFLFEFIRMGK